MKKKTLLELRKETKTRQRILMDLLKVDRKTLYNWEHCRTAPDHWQLQTLCKFYGVKKTAVKIADRYDPYAFLPEDKTYEEWKAEYNNYLQETEAWWNRNITRPVNEIIKNRKYNF